MSKEIRNNAVNEWKYSSSLTLKAVEDMPADKWNDSPHPKFASFAKQVRHVICCRGVFAEGFSSGSVNFSKKHSFYSGELTREALLTALKESTALVQASLERLDGESLNLYKADYYGESLGFVEHFSALVCHEALHRGQWSLYSVMTSGKEAL